METLAEKIGVDLNANLLGEIVTWDMGAMEIPYDKVLSALQNAGLPTEDAAELRPQTAFKRAINDLREGRAIDKIKMDSASGLIHFQFTRKHLDSSAFRLDFAFEAVCTLDPSTGYITCDDSPEIEAHARTMFAHALRHRNTSDVTRLVQRLFTNHADLYPINPKKGVAYFVPEAHRDFSAQVDEFLSALGGHLGRFPVPRGTEAGNRSVKIAVEEGLKSLSDELEDVVDSWSNNTRESTMQHAIERWQNIKHKAEAYSEYLGDRQADLLSRLDAQKRRLAAKIQELTAARERNADASGDWQTSFLGTEAEEHTHELAMA